MPPQEETLITVIVTHFNYAHMIENALRSVAAQSHAAFECIIVDDFSNTQNRNELRHIITNLADPRFKLVELSENKGQINAVFEGLSQSSGEFVSIIDPDDLYEPDFLMKMLKCHLNPCVYTSVAACEMGLFRIGGPVLTRSYVGFKHDAVLANELAKYEASLLDFGFSKFYPPEIPGWLWATTSSLMFRRDALEALRRETYLAHTKIHADTYCVFGAHMLGGTLFVDELLSWRGLHKENSVEVEGVIYSNQNHHRANFDDISSEVKTFAMKTLLENGTFRYLRKKDMANVLRSHFDKKTIAELLTDHPDIALLVLQAD